MLAAPAPLNSVSAKPVLDGVAPLEDHWRAGRLDVDLLLVSDVTCKRGDTPFVQQNV
jgi:hypothetical protein